MAGLKLTMPILMESLRKDLQQAWDEHYGNNPEHPGQFFDIESQTWIFIPEYTMLYDEPKDSK